jgi:integrase
VLRAVRPEARQSVRPGRVAALMKVGFTERHARFLVHVLVFSGVFLERQYRAFTGLVHGQKTHDFLTRLVGDGYATAITPGALHRGRFYHVHYKPLYEAIGEANNRHRRPASLGRVVERLMLLDAVLADARYGWLGTYLVPAFGRRRLDAIRNEDVQRLKAQLQCKSPKTVNNVLTVLSVLLKKAVEWEVIYRLPCTVKLLRVDKGNAAFHDVEEYERLVVVAGAIDGRTLLIVLLGGDAGLRCGETLALEWDDIDLAKRQLCVRQSDWNGQVGTPKNGRLRYVPLTRRLASALAEHRHLRSRRVLCQNDGAAFTRQIVQNRMRLAAKRANVRKGIHILRHTFCSHLAMRGAPAKAIQELAGHADLTMTQRYMHLSPAALDAAIRLLDRPSGDQSFGDILETPGPAQERSINPGL